MSSLAVIVRLVTYDRRVFEAYERGVKKLGWAEAVRDRGIGHRSFKDTLVHVLNVHESLLIAVAQGRREVWKNPARGRENVRSWSDLRRYREGVWKGIDELVAGLNESRSKRTVKVPWLPGRYTLEDVFFQSSFEQAHHLGEIIGVYWQMDRTPPQMMFIPTVLGTRVSVR
jgi:uncharacterized damage-inducible protein DinB